MADRSLSIPAAALGLLLAAGMVIGAGQIAKALVEGKRERTVTVRGLSEREVKADTAVWPIRFTATSQDLPGAYAKSEADKKAVLAFLANAGMKPDEIEVGQLDVTDTQARGFGGDKAQSRFIVSQVVTVNTTKVEQVAVLAIRVAELVKTGVVLGSTRGIGYHFTGVNAIKPGMLAEATKNARAAAAQFAADSGAQVGSIMRATQGALSIVPLVANDGGGGDDEGFSGGGAEHSIKQKVRVVMTVVFLLDR